MNINNLAQYDNVQTYVKTRCKQRTDANTSKEYKRINKHSKLNRKAMRAAKRQQWSNNLCLVNLVTL